MPDKSDRKPLTYDEIRDTVSKKIDEAVARGEFDNLPHQGKKIDLSTNPFSPADWQMAMKVLKDNNVAPEFVERRRKVEAIREEMKSVRGEHALRRLAEKLKAEVEALNACTARENDFIQTSLQLPPIDVEEEVRKYAK